MSNGNNLKIDVHVHFGAPEGPPEHKEYCYWSEKFKGSAAFLAMKVITGNLVKEITFQLTKDQILKAINEAKEVDRCVLLAMDAVYDSNDGSKPKMDMTNLYVSNECIIALIKDIKNTSKKILFGASIHPFRNDWQNVLNYCLANGAVLCKWVPSSMLIDPTHDKCIPFFQKLVEHNLPLLWHCGPEYAIPSSDTSYNTFNSPYFMRKALDLGVTVIAAHCATPYFPTDSNGDFYTLLNLFSEAPSKQWKLYADLSAMCNIYRNKFILEIKSKIPQERLILGSDYPIPIADFTYVKDSNFFHRIQLLLKTFFMKNQIDKNFELLEGMGFDKSVFTNADGLFQNIIR
jgi:hypothetical protein